MELKIIDSNNEKLPSNVENEVKLNNNDNQGIMEICNNQKIKGNSQPISKFKIENFDELCDGFMRIEKLITLRYSKLKISLLILLNLLTAFIINLFIVWFPSLKLSFIYSECPLSEAKFVGVYASDGKFYVENLEKLILPDIRDSHLKLHCKSNIIDNQIYLFEFKLFKYFYDTSLNNFNSINFCIKTTQEILNKEFLRGLNKEEVAYNKLIFGECDINIKVEGIFMLTLKEVTDPFYLFQLFSVILWFNNEYMIYAGVIIGMTAISIFVSVWETRSNMISIQKMSKYSCPVEISRREKDSKQSLPSSSVDLVPGDLFELPEDGLALPCDCILVSGTVIVNESMLTGESTPIIKTQIPNTNTIFDPNVDKKYILFAGTKIIQKRASNNSKVMGIVSTIGFNTEKGNLIRNILFPKEIKFKFQRDSIRYIIFMGCVALIGFFIILPFMIQNEQTAKEIILKLLDLITITVPPALPACLGIGISIALNRLKSWGIMCINRERINVSGSVNMICFDKTGTLTEDHLEVHGFRPVKLIKGCATFDNYIQDCEKICETTFNYYKEKTKGGKQEKSKDLKMLFMESISSCHSITKVNGKLIGDPIDIEMFEATGWTLNENLENKDNQENFILTSIRPPQEKDLKEKLASDENEKDQIFKTHYELGIIRRFDFTSKLQRMSVLVKNSNEPYFKVFCKGSPEKIKELCKSDTIPANFNEVLSGYTTQGLRVLAISMKMLKIDLTKSQMIDREIAESNMVFLGLIVVKNKLKSKTSSSIQQLRDANLRMVMATGDNILTAIAVAKECTLIKPDSVMYTCDINRENNERSLKWNFVENFLNHEDEKINLEEHVYGSRMSKMSNEDSRGFTIYLSPESFDEGCNKETDVKLVFPEIKEDINDIGKDKGDILNVDVENNPIKEGNKTEYVIAISGTTFETLWKLRSKYLTTKNDFYKIYYDTFKLILQNCYIYARMSPDHKTILVECLREEKFIVCMCGDGANDCGALRAADVGVSLSTEEASIAAPFTSKITDISCLIKLFREGKASLVTSIQTFKYMMIYSLIQFISSATLLVFNSYLSELQFLTSDLFIILPMAILTSRTRAARILTKHRTSDDLISFPIIGSIIIQTLIVLSAQVGGRALLADQIWYENKCEDIEENQIPCMDNTTVFLISVPQYIIMAIAFSTSKPFRRAIYTNFILCIFIIAESAYVIYLIVGPDPWSISSFFLVEFPEEMFKYYILIIAFANLIVSYIVDKIIIVWLADKWQNYKHSGLLRKLKS